MRRLFEFAMRAPHIVGPAAGIVIVIAIGIYSLSEGEAYRNAAARASKTRAVVKWAEQLVSLVRDAESGQRGYLLTGDQRFLAPYTEALPQIDFERARLRTLSPVHP